MGGEVAPQARLFLILADCCLAPMERQFVQKFNADADVAAEPSSPFAVEHHQFREPGSKRNGGRL
jgi:hypothetical protein